MDWWIDEDTPLDPPYSLSEYVEHNSNTATQVTSRTNTPDRNGYPVLIEELKEISAPTIKSGDSFVLDGNTGLIEEQHFTYLYGNAPVAHPGQYVWVGQDGNVYLSEQPGAAPARVIQRTSTNIKVTFWV